MLETKTILIIDDEGDILHILSFLLKSEGYRVVQAMDGGEALDLISKIQFAAIVSDLRMPNMDGLTLIEEVRSQKNFIPFIFLSGHADAADEHRMINFGAWELIHKPHVEKVPLTLKKLLNAHITDVSPEDQEFMEIVHSSRRKIA